MRGKHNAREVLRCDCLIFSKKILDHSSIVGGANNGWLQPASFCVESSRLKSAVIAKCSSVATKSAAALVFLHFFNSNHFKLFAFPLLMKFSNANATTKYIVLCRMEGSSIFKQRIFTEFYCLLGQCLACSNDHMSHNILISF